MKKIVEVMEWDNIVQTNGTPMQMVANRRGRSAHTEALFVGLPVLVVAPGDETDGDGLDVCMALSYSRDVNETLRWSFIPPSCQGAFCVRM